MKVRRGLPNGENASPCVLTIGNFDGQHLGHRALLKAVVESAMKSGGTPTVLTFEPHPAKVLMPGLDLLFLSGMEEKIRGFEEAGIAEVVIVEFNDALSRLTPEEFVFGVLQKGLCVRKLLVGEHFVFGKGRSGSIEDLRRLGPQAGFDVHPVSPVRVNGQVVSSTRIRSLILSGEVSRAAALLGRFYAIEGPVVSGDGRGQDLGWPTANLRLPSERVVPADGVYAARVEAGGQGLDAVAYIGSRPTFGPGERRLEVHLLDEQRDLYGKPLRACFVERLRGDRVFSTEAELAAGIELDVARARECLQRAVGSSTGSGRAGL